MTLIGLQCFLKGTSCNSSDKVLSITPRTQEQVDVLKNISSQHEVQVTLFSLCLMRIWWVHKLKTCFPADSVMAACVTPAHLGGDSGPPVCPCALFRNCCGSPAKSQHDLWVSHSPWQISLHSDVSHSWPQLRLLSRVLLDNANELIEMQTRNDSSDPRSSVGFYEKYHNLEDVSVWCCWRWPLTPEMFLPAWTNLARLKRICICCVYWQIYEWINRTQQENPSTVKLILIGSSAEKRPLYVLKVCLYL